jgi:hypothetical protein
LVNVRNVNADNFSGTITVINANSFSLTTANSGAASGSAAAYSLGFTYSGTPSATALTIAAPGGGDCQLLSLLYATGARTTATIDITVPQSATNGSGLDTTLQNVFFPNISVKATAAGGAVNATLSLYPNALGGSNYNVFKIGTLSTSLSQLIRLNF